jgi:hypothetical protein
MEEGAGAVKNKADNAEPNGNENQLPRRSTHEPASVLTTLRSVKDGVSVARPDCVARPGCNRRTGQQRSVYKEVGDAGLRGAKDRKDTGGEGYGRQNKKCCSYGCEIDGHSPI